MTIRFPNRCVSAVCGYFRKVFSYGSQLSFKSMELIKKVLASGCYRSLSVKGPVLRGKGNGQNFREKAGRRQ